MRGIKTRTGTVPFPTYIPVTRLGTRGGLDARVQPALPSVARAVMVGHTVFDHKNAVLPQLPVMVTSGSAHLLSYGAMAARRGEIGEIHFPSRKKSLTPERVLEIQEAYADIAFTFDFPIPYGLDPIEASRRQDLTIGCALWALTWKKRKDLLLYACVQGWDKESFRQCAKAYKGKGFAGLAIGGLSTKADNVSHVLSILEAVLEEADGKPIHMFNQGDPRMVRALLKEEGVASVSSNSWMSLANEGRFWNNPSAKLIKPTPKDKLLIALWNLSCATGRKANSIAADIVRMEKTIDSAESVKSAPPASR